MSTVTDFLYSGTELDALAEAHNYYRCILSYFAPHLGRRIVEVGAGIGTFSERLLNAAEPEEMVLVEPADNNIEGLRQRFAERSAVRVVHGYLDAVVGSVAADSVVAVNVMEHVEDDVAFLRGAHELLNPGGHLLLFVPAGQWLYGAMDAAFDHYRRYDKPMLTDRLHAAGFGTFHLRYFNLPGIVPWFITGRVLKRTTVLPRDARRYDRWVMPWLAPLERWCEPPIGQSLLVIARKD